MRAFKAVFVVVTLVSTFAVALCCQAQSGAPVQASRLTLKKPLHGIVSMGDISFHRLDGGTPNNSLAVLERMPGVLDGLIINFTWEQLQPTPGSVDFSPIEAVLQTVRVYNRNNPQKPLQLGLRIWPGPNAPKWAKSLGGDPVTVYHRGDPITVGRFWTKPYRQAWRKLMTDLGRKYDSDPLIVQVTNSSGSSITDEPVIVPGDPKSLANLKAAGFTDQQFREARLESGDDFAAWKTTIVECAFSPYRHMDSGTPVFDPEMTLTFIRSWRESMGARGLLGNHALNSPLQPEMVPAFKLMKELGQPIEFQTHSPNGLDWDGTVRNAISLGATAVELWPEVAAGGFTSQPVETLKSWSEQLRTNLKK